jgi:hypothetical protein
MSSCGWNHPDLGDPVLSDRELADLPHAGVSPAEREPGGGVVPPAVVREGAVHVAEPGVVAAADPDRDGGVVTASGRHQGGHGLGTLPRCECVHTPWLSPKYGW